MHFFPDFEQIVVQRHDERASLLLEEVDVVHGFLPLHIPVRVADLDGEQHVRFGEDLVIVHAEDVLGGGVPLRVNDPRRVNVLARQEVEVLRNSRFREPMVGSGGPNDEPRLFFVRHTGIIAQRSATGCCWLWLDADGLDPALCVLQVHEPIVVCLGDVREVRRLGTRLVPRLAPNHVPLRERGHCREADYYVHFFGLELMMTFIMWSKTCFPVSTGVGGGFGRDVRYIRYLGDQDPIAGVLSRPIIHLSDAFSTSPPRSVCTAGHRCTNPFPRRAASARTVWLAAESLWYGRVSSPTERQALLYAAPNFLKPCGLRWIGS